MQDPRGPPRVAQVLERHELRPQVLRARPILCDRRIEERGARTRRDAPGSRREAGQRKVTHVDNGGTLAHPADDAATLDAAEEAVEVWIAARILEDDRVLDRDGDPLVDQPADDVEAGLFVAAESLF